MSRLSKLPSSKIIKILKIVKFDDKSDYINYAVKQHRGNWYVYIQKFSGKYIRRHGPYSTQQLAEDKIHAIEKEIKDVAASKAHSQNQATQI